MSLHLKRLQPKFKTFLPAVTFFRADSSSATTKKKWSYFHGPGQEPLIGDTVGNVVDRAAELYGAKEAVVFCENNIRKNFLQLKQDVDKFAAGLIAIGLKHGNRIGIWSPNYYEWIVTQYASAKAGLILVNLNPAYQTRELEYSLKKVGVRALIIPEKFKTRNYYEMICSISPSIPNSSPGQIKDKLENFTHLIMMSEKQFGGAFRFTDVANAGQNSHYKELEALGEQIQFDDPVNIQFTSGTTGSPKGATLTHFNIINNSYLIGKRLLLHENTRRHCIPLPLYHSFGSICGSLTCMQFGSCQVYPGSFFSAKTTAEAIQNEKCTHLYGTTTMYIDLCNLPDFNEYDLSSLHRGIMGGASCPPELLKTISKKLDVYAVTCSYGTTETSPGITSSSSQDSIDIRSIYVGKVMDHTEIKIVDPNTNLIVPCGQSGELWTRGYLVMQGYWNDPIETEKSITKDRWYKTGDLAIATEDGYIKIIGRTKDMIIRGGENIYPKEIEDFLHTHPKIAEAHVIGVPDNRLGEEICAVIRLKNGENLEEMEVKEFCRGQLSHFKVPRFVKFVNKFPMTITGKVQKFVLKNTFYY